MPRLTAKDFPQELLDYYDYYAHGKISKREVRNLAAKCGRPDYGISVV